MVVSEIREDSVTRPRQDQTITINPNREEATADSEMTTAADSEITEVLIIPTAVAASDPVAEALAAEAAAVDSDPAAVEAAASEVADN